MSAPEFDPEADLVARMRAAGFTVRAATLDTLTEQAMAGDHSNGAGDEANLNTGPSMSASSERKQAFIAHLRAAGLEITPATRDTLPPPRHTIPPRQFFFRMRAGLRRLSPSALRMKRRHATVP
jgi:hypothetical protein